MQCPYCNTVNSADALFCEECGQRMPEQDTCSQCGTLIKPHFIYCKRCGMKLGAPDAPPVPEKPLFCPACGVPCESDSHFCTECGNAL